MNLNLTAPCNALGMGIVGANLIVGLTEAGASVSYFPIGPVEPPPTHGEAVRLARKAAEYYDPTAPSVRYWHPSDMAHHVGRGLRISYTIFETDTLPTAAKHQLRNSDLVVVPTSWASKVCETNGVPREKLRVVNHGVDPGIFYPMPLPSSGPTIFFASGKWEIRKGHLEVCQSFNAAFKAADDVRLVVHCSNPFLSETESKEWWDYFMTSPMGKVGKIEIVGGRFTRQEEVAALVAQVHCGVFPSRAEGWNLPLSECMAMGRHVIATDYSAHTEFCTPGSCRLINVDKLEPAFDGRWFKGEGNWAHLGERQIEQMVWHMRTIHREQTEGRLALNVKGIERMASFTWQAACQQLMNVLSE